MIQIFWAVTASMHPDRKSVSLYRVEVAGDKPIAEKRALRGTSKYDVGARLATGPCFGIETRGLMYYMQDHSALDRGSSEEKRKRPDQVNENFHFGHSAPIVGLFLREEDAQTCFSSEGLEQMDCRWAREIVETLRAIGDDHSHFVLSGGLAALIRGFVPCAVPPPPLRPGEYNRMTSSEP